MLSLGTMAVVSVLWVLVGYSLAFAPSISSGAVGDLSFALVDFPDGVRAGTAVPEHVFIVYQCMFAVITPAVISGAIVTRMTYPAFLAFAALWHILVYCPLAHWVWEPSGWLARMGVLDFAGGTVVESASGVSAFVLAYWLGPSPKHHTTNPHNVPYILLGASLLCECGCGGAWGRAASGLGLARHVVHPACGPRRSSTPPPPRPRPRPLPRVGFGWMGFNAGGGPAGPYGGRLLINTHVSASIAMIAWGVLEWVFPPPPPGAPFTAGWCRTRGSCGRGCAPPLPISASDSACRGPLLFTGRPTSIGAACGAVVGLVAITPACGYVTTMWALFIAAFAALAVFFAQRNVKYLGVDDRLDVFAFHGISGMIGTALTGLFASTGADAPVDGAFYGSRTARQFGVQLTAISATVLLCAVGTTAIYFVLTLCTRALGTNMRIAADTEDIDASQHGEAAYSYREGSVHGGGAGLAGIAVTARRRGSGSGSSSSARGHGHGAANARAASPASSGIPGALSPPATAAMAAVYHGGGGGSGGVTPSDVVAIVAGTQASNGTRG